MGRQGRRTRGYKVMPLTITPDPSGDTPAVVEDKVRALPENQGKNESEMWELIDKEVEAVRKAGKLRDTESYKPEDKHRN